MTTTTDTTTRTTAPPVLVAGGTGRTGRRVVQQLQALGRPVRVGSRSARPPFDWTEPGTWAAALDGVDAVYVAFHPDLGFPGAAGILGAFAATAADHGVQRLVLLSGRGEEEAARSEDAVRAALPSTTVLRASWFAQNFSEHFLLGPVLDGVIALPAGDVREPFVDLDDVAACAVAALVDDHHAGRRYELTGPRLLGFAEVADELTRATGRPITYVSVSADDYIAGALAQGLPAEEVVPLAGLFTTVLDGRNAHTTRDVEEILGRPAGDFATYARNAAASGVWITSSPAVAP